MALMERVATLLRANVNDLVSRAEDPEKMIRQLLLDMENQLLQVKTQVAIALADQHLLEKRTKEQEATVASWHRRAELAVAKADDTLARAALERALNHESLLETFRAQVGIQTTEAEALRTSYAQLQGKLSETQARCESIIAQHRRARVLSRATEARTAAENSSLGKVCGLSLDQWEQQVQQAEARSHAVGAIPSSESLEERLAQLERDDRVEELLSELKSKQSRLLPTG